MDDDGRRRRRTLLLQKYVLNPPTKPAVHPGLVPGHAVVKTSRGTSLLTVRFDLDRPG